MPGTQQDGSLERQLSAAADLLQAVLRARREGREDDQWRALRRLLGALHELDELARLRLGPVTWHALRGSSPGGRTFAALVWVRDVAQCHRADVEGLGWLRTAEFVYLGDGRWKPIGGAAAPGARRQEETAPDPVLLWPPFVDLPPGRPERGHRDEWYDRLVAMRDLVDPLQVAVHWIRSSLSGPGRV